MWLIDKTFEFCYGHRVWTQELDGRFSDDLKCACRHLHGHEGKVQVFITGDSLNPQGMVTDFRHLEWLKKWLNQYVDHQFIIDRSDPLFDTLFPPSLVTLNNLYLVSESQSFQIGSELVFDTSSTPSYLQEMFEGVLVVDFPPTSENLAKWLCEIVTFKMKPLHVTIKQIDWWETPKSRSTFIQN